MVSELVKKDKIDQIFNSEFKKKVLDKNYFMLVPYSSKVASLARLVQKSSAEKSAVCLCFYIDKSKNFYYSSNSNEYDEKLENSGFAKDFALLKDFLETGFHNNQESDSKAKTKFLIEAFEKNNFLYSQISFLETRLCSILRKSELRREQFGDQIYEILNLIYLDFFCFKPNKNISFLAKEECLINHFQNILDKVKILLSELKNSKISALQKKALELISPVALYIEDFLNVSSLSLNNPLEKIIIESFKAKRIKKANCQGSRKTHCEMRMWEHLSHPNGEMINQSAYQTLLEAVSEKRFIVSKFCCGHCEISLSSWNKAVKSFPNLDQKMNSLSLATSAFSILGKSSSFFPGWQSPKFKVEQVFNKTQELIHENLDKFSKEKTSSNNHPLIENSEVEYLVNQIIVPEAFLT